MSFLINFHPTKYPLRSYTIMNLNLIDIHNNPSKINPFYFPTKTRINLNITFRILQTHNFQPFVTI